MFPQRRPDARPPPAAGPLLIRLQPRPDADTGLHAERQGSGWASRARSGGDTFDTTHERSTARSVASSTARPSTRSGSRTPARRRAVSSSRAPGTGTRGDPPADETELASLRGLVDGLREELQRKRDEAAGDRQQLQATIDDLIATQAAGPGLPGGGATGGHNRPTIGLSGPRYTQRRGG